MLPTRATTGYNKASNGLLHIDNNPVENIIGLVALGRKNYLFASSHAALQMSPSFTACLPPAKPMALTHTPG